jgi:hypothetical protein
MSSEKKSLSPRFFYGRAKQVVDEKVGYQLCLADLEAEKIVWFEKPYQLFETIRKMVNPVILQDPHFGGCDLPKQEDVREVSDNLDDEQPEENKAPSFSVLLMLAKGRDASGELREAIEYNQQLVEDLEMIDFVEEVKDRERFAASVGVSFNDLAPVEIADETGDDTVVYGPFFKESDFTCEVGHLTVGLLVSYDFFDVSFLKVQVKAAIEDFESIKNEVEVIFHPEKAEILKRSKGLCGFNAPSSVNADEFAGKDNN